MSGTDREFTPLTFVIRLSNRVWKQTREAGGRIGAEPASAAAVLAER
jgi:hypothetical protein